MNSVEVALELLIARAAAAGASDVVIDPRDDAALVVIARCDGLREQLGIIPAGDATRTIGKLKGLANLPAYITDEVQDGVLDGRPFGIVGELRLACLPTVRGQRLALRLPMSGTLPQPTELGLSPEVLVVMRHALRRREGLVLVTGPTGSGKTTTIHSLLAELASERTDRQILTIEDPVERRIPGIAQVAVAPLRGFGYAEALSAALRQDANVLVVGEVRDRVTAAACLTAALTGHLVISTVHCGRATEAVRRLVDLGVDSAHLHSALSVVLAQRLVRRRHAACAGAGCADCREGYRGRLPVTDLLECHAANRRKMAERLPPDLTADLDQQAAALIAAGVTSSEEIARSGA